MDIKFTRAPLRRYLPGNQVASKSSVEAYIQVLLSGCKCVELDVFGLNKKIMIFHGTIGVPLFSTMIYAEDVLKAIAMYAFKVSPYPLILSIENHLKPELQEEFAKLLKRILGGKLAEYQTDSQLAEYLSLLAP
eukprot:sb/3474820/